MTDPQAMLPPAGWYPDPAGSGGERYWDGQTWSNATRVVQLVQSPVPQGLQLASWGWRVLAAILDWVILILPLSYVQRLASGDAYDLLDQWLVDLMYAVQSGSTYMPEPPAELFTQLLIGSLVVQLCWVLYRTIMVAQFGGSLGKLATGLRVVPAEATTDTRVGYGRSLLRAVLRVVLDNIIILNVINWLMPLFTARRQTWHDMAARTLVIKK